MRETSVRTSLARLAVVALLASGVALLGAGPSGACTASRGIGGGGGLVPNGDLERAVTEPDPVGATIYQANVQPLAPEGWVFEGAAGLFDYADVRADTVFCSREAVSGYRFLAISAPAGTKTEYCVGLSQIGVGECVPSPAETVKENSNLAYAADPHWRNAVPVAVTGGRGYMLDFWTEQEAVTINTGAIARVRWLDALGVPIKVDTLYYRNQDDEWGTKLGWERVTRGVGAPGNAAFAVVLLGHSSDIGIGQVRFDNVYFG